MAMQVQLLENTLGQIAEAAFQSEVWSQVLGSVVQLTGSSDAQLTGLNDGVVSSLLLHNLDPAVLPKWVELGGADLSNPIMAAGNAVPVLGTWRDSEAFSEEDRRRSPLWQEVYEKHGLQHLNGGLVWGEATDKVALVVTRDRTRGALEGENLDLFHRVLVAANGALTVARTLGEDRARIMASAFDLMSRAAFLLDAFGNVLAESCAAAAMRREPGLFRGRGAKLQLADTDANRRLEAAMKAMSGPRPLPRSVASLQVEAIGGRDRRGIILRVMPAPPSAYQLPLGCSLVVLAEPAALDAGLSSAEREVMELLALGLRASEIAGRRRVSLETARSQIKAVYAKLGVRGQTELMAQILRDRSGA